MGAYLSQPITEKHSTDESNETYACGASSMQGWRMTQEDAHNCILNFDTNASLFTVFDGHGGAEVALYCAAELPRYIKVHDEYKKGNYDAALREAFIGFDGTLVNKAVIEELKKLIQNEKVEAESETEDDLAELHEESRMSISEVLEKYKDGKAIPILTKLKAGEASGSKPISPYLRGRRNGCGSENADGAGKADDPSSSGGFSASTRRQLERDTEEDEAVSSSCTPDKLKLDMRNSDKQSIDAPDSSSAKLALDQTPEISASSSSTGVLSPTTTSITKTTNGDATASNKPSQENEISTNSAKTESVSSSSAVIATETAENGSASKISTSNAKARSSKVRRNPNMPMMNIDGDSSSDDDEDDSYEEEKSSSTDEGDADGDDLAVPNSDDSGDSVEGEDDEDDEDSEDEDMYPDDDDEQSFLNNMIEGPGMSSGCTAVVALIVGRDLFVANAGDSRCVVCRDGKALDMSIDHKPEDKEELDRIKNAGGKVTVDGRVNGGLNLSRAIGDHAYKMNKDLKAEEQMISAVPDIKKITITSADEFMVIACDGIWNYMTSEEVVDFVKQRLDEGQAKISTICEELFTNCLAANTNGDGTGCDNMTAVIVKFKPAIHEQPAVATGDDKSVSANKRSASPVHDEAEPESCHKRFKTGEAIVDSAAGAEETD